MPVSAPRWMATSGIGEMEMTPKRDPPAIPWQPTVEEYHAIRRERDVYGAALSQANHLIGDLLRKGCFLAKDLDTARETQKEIYRDSQWRAPDVKD